MTNCFKAWPPGLEPDGGIHDKLIEGLAARA